MGKIVSSAILVLKSDTASQSKLPIASATVGIASLQRLIRGRYLFLLVG